MLPVPTIWYSLLVLLIFGTLKRRCLLGHLSVFLWHSIKGHAGAFVFWSQQKKKVWGKQTSVFVLYNCRTFVYLNSSVAFMYSMNPNATVLLEREKKIYCSFSGDLQSQVEPPTLLFLNFFQSTHAACPARSIHVKKSVWKNVFFNFKKSAILIKE